MAFSRLAAGLKPVRHKFSDPCGAGLEGDGKTSGRCSESQASAFSPFMQPLSGIEPALPDDGDESVAAGHVVMQLVVEIDAKGIEAMS